MRDLGTLVQELQSDGHFVNVTRNPLAQFGQRNRQYLGATLLPEREVPDIAYREDAVRFRSIIANDGTRYSPVQKKGNELVSSFLVELGNSDIGREISSRQYETILRLLRSDNELAAMNQILDWSDTVLNRALVEKNELQRFQAIVLAQVTRQGDNGYSEVVQYSNPSGHRVNAGGTWSNNSYDPFADIMDMKVFLAGKGFAVNRIITSLDVVTILSMNALVQARVGLPIVNIAGTITVAQQAASIEAINGALNRNGLPPIEQYDLQYTTSNGTAFFLPRNVFVMVCTTGQDELIDLGDNERMLENILGYMGVGPATGHPNPGRVMKVDVFADKPPRIEGQAWQCSLPVILEPEAMGVIGAIS